jgi:hypothetical protein
LSAPIRPAFDVGRICIAPHSNLSVFGAHCAFVAFVAFVAFARATSSYTSSSE